MQNDDALRECRDAFEKWYTSGEYKPTRNGDDYHYKTAQNSWLSWQAAWNTRANANPPSVFGEVLSAIKSAALRSSYPWSQYTVTEQDYKNEGSIELAQGLLALLNIGKERK